MNIEEKRIKRVEIYAIIFELREKDEKRSKEELAKCVWQGVIPRMKRKITPGSGVG
jgi:hypothetical protein